MELSLLIALFIYILHISVLCIIKIIPPTFGQCHPHNYIIQCNIYYCTLNIFFFGGGAVNKNL